MHAGYTNLTVRSTTLKNQTDSRTKEEGVQTEREESSGHPKEPNGLLRSVWNRGFESDLGGFRQAAFELVGHLHHAVAIRLPESALSSPLKAMSGNFVVYWLSPVQVVQKGETQDPHPTLVPLLLPSGLQFLTLMVPSAPSPTICKA